jgi:FkbM family methyltransferase
MGFWAKAIRLPLRALPPGMVVPILSGRLQGRKWIVGAGVHSFWIGSYELNKQRAFAELVHSGETVFDLGANVGFYTLMASELTGPSGHVYAFEPVARNLRYLRRHLSLNAVTNVTVIEAAVSDVRGLRRFQIHESTAMGHLNDRGQTEVRTFTLDQLVFGNIVKVPNSIKIDVEGAELSVFQGARELLARHRPALLFATHSCELRSQCLRFLRAHGYTVRPIETGRDDEADEFLGICDGGSGGV